MDQSQAKQTGFYNDRMWMVVDSSGRYISQREEPKMATLQIVESDDNFLVQHKLDQSKLFSFKKNPDENQRLDVSIWEHNVNARLVSAHIDKILSTYFERSCHLVYMDSDSSRKKSLTISPGTTKLSFADGYPYLIITEGSLLDLNARMNQSLPMNRFRPNIVISDANAYEEESMKNFSIGEAKFRMVKPCIRCIIPTIDQFTGERSSEPLKTLSTYKKVGKNIHFGMNAICIKPGLLKQGDEVYTY